jgi:hypothetical protein
MQLRRRDVEKWMSHRRLPEDLRRFLYRTYKLLFSPKQNLASLISLLQSFVTNKSTDLLVFHD